MTEESLLGIKKKLNEVENFLNRNKEEAKWINRTYEGYIKSFEHHDSLFASLIIFYDEVNKCELEAFVYQDMSNKYLNKTLRITCQAEETACSVAIWRYVEIEVISEESELQFFERIYKDRSTYIQVMNSYTKLSDTQRENCVCFIKRFLGEYYDYDRKKLANVSYSSNAEKWKYEVCQCAFPDNIKNTIENVLLPYVSTTDHKGPGNSDECLAKSAQRALDSLYHFDYGMKNKVPLNFCGRLEEFHIGDKAAIREFTAKISGNCAFIKPFLFINKNGGLRHLIKTIGMCSASLKMAEIDASVLTSDREAYLGSSLQYSNSEMGIFFHKLESLENFYSILVIKNVDCISDNMGSILVPLLVEKKYYNKTLESEFDLSRMIIILTAENVDEVPISISAACDTITLDNYSDEETRHILIRAIDHFNYTNQMDISFSKNAINRILESYCSNGEICLLDEKMKYLYKKLYDVGKDKMHVTTPSLVKYLPDLSEANRCKLICEKPNTFVDLVDKYTNLRSLYSKEYRRLIDANISRYKRLRAGDPDREKALRAINLGINSIGIKKELDWNTAKENATKTHLCIEKKTNEIINVFQSKKPLYLYGAPGVGKTTLMQSIATELGISYRILSLNNVADKDYFEGSKFNPSILLEIQAESQTEDIFIVLDEFDKASPQIQNMMLDILDLTNHVTDQYTGLPIDIDRFHFVATGNSSNLTDYVLDRMCLVELKGYSRKQKKHILLESILPSLERKFDIKVSIQDKVAEYLVKYFCPTPGIRDLPKMLSKLVLSNRDNTDKNMSITINDVNSILGEYMSIKMLENDNYRKELEPGIALGMAICSDGRGTIIAHQFKKSSSDKDDVITGLIEGSAKESISIAEGIISSLLNIQENISYSCHNTDAGVKKDGPSAGACVTIGILSYHLGIPLTGLAFSGEIDIHGNIYGVGGIFEKLQACDDCDGIKTVYIPYSNYQKLTITGELESFENINVIGVKTIKELAEKVFGKEVFNENGRTDALSGGKNTR